MRAQRGLDVARSYHDVTLRVPGRVSIHRKQMRLQACENGIYVKINNGERRKDGMYEREDVLEKGCELDIRHKEDNGMN